MAKKAKKTKKLLPPKDPKTPDGWQESQHGALQSYGLPICEIDRPIKCGDCGWIGKASDLDDEHDFYAIRELNERLTSGDPSPVGLCPNDDADWCDIGNDGCCGAFVYYDDVKIIYHAKRSG